MAMTLKEEAKKFLADVPQDKVFWCTDGRIFKNMQDLKDALESMTEETYPCHANPEKNDFARWVRDVIEDEQLAKDLEKATSRARAARYVSSRVSILKKRLS